MLVIVGATLVMSKHTYCNGSDVTTGYEGSPEEGSDKRYPIFLDNESFKPDESCKSFVGRVTGVTHLVSKVRNNRYCISLGKPFFIVKVEPLEN